MRPAILAVATLFLVHCSHSVRTSDATVPVVQPAASSSPQEGFVAKSFTVQRVGSGTPMILIPGLSCAAEVWDGTVKKYSGEYDMHVLTLAGFAGIPRIDGPLLETARAELIQYINHHKLDKPVVVGHSLGGFLAYWVGSTAGDQVGPIIVVDAVPFIAPLVEMGDTAAIAKPAAARMRDIMGAMQPAEFAAHNRKILSGMITDAANVNLVAASSGNSNPKAVAEAMYEMCTTDLRENVAAIKSPVLVVAAGSWANTQTKIAALKKSYSAQIAAIPNKKLVVAEKARHFVMLDDPNFLFKEMDMFLAAQN